MASSAEPISTESSSNIRYGSCLCRAVKYSVTGEPITRVICHCDNDRKASGSAFQANSLYPKEAFHVLQGQETIKTYHDSATDSGATLNRAFCRICGSPLFTLNETNPALAGAIIVGTGSMDGPQDFKPEQEFYCKRRYDFLPELQGTKKHETM